MKNGTYAAYSTVNRAWRILEYHDGVWWHPAKVARWMPPDPVNFVYLPDPTMEFDL